MIDPLIPPLFLGQGCSVDTLGIGKQGKVKSSICLKKKKYYFQHLKKYRKCCSKDF